MLNADPPKRVEFRFLSGFGAILFSVSVDFGEILRLCGIFRLRVVESADLGFLPKITWWCVGKFGKFFRHARWPIFPTIFARKNEKTNKETLPEERFGTFTRLSFGRALEFH